MSYILCIETATTNCSVALVKENNLVACKEDYNNSYSHAELLHCFIEEILIEADISPKDLASIAVSKGPGSYTGLRIGVSAAKGLCYALNIPLIAVPTLDSLALQVEEAKDCFVVPMIDARRMEVYSAIYQHQRQIRKTQAQILDSSSFMDSLEKGKVFFIGNGILKFEALCTHQNAKFIKNKLPSAKEMAIVVYSKFLNKEFENVVYFEPYYLKDFISGPTINS